MSPNTKAFHDWYAGLPIPWLVSGTNGQAEANGWPLVVDNQVGLLDAARKVAYPDYTPSDALPHLGADRGLIQGLTETDANFRIRVKDAWSQWSRAGTALAVLEQLYYFGLSGVTWYQQNGLKYTLSSPPTAGQDPTSLLVATATETLTNDLTSTVAPYRTIPAGTAWFAFDGNTDLCNRFMITATSWPGTSADLGKLQRIIMTFRPNAICVGVNVSYSGRAWGIGGITWGDGGTWGGSLTQILGSF